MGRWALHLSRGPKLVATRTPARVYGSTAAIHVHAGAGPRTEPAVFKHHSPTGAPTFLMTLRSLKARGWWLGTPGPELVLWMDGGSRHRHFGAWQQGLLENQGLRTQPVPGPSVTGLPAHLSQRMPVLGTRTGTVSAWAVNVVGKALKVKADTWTSQ